MKTKSAKQDKNTPSKYRPKTAWVPGQSGNPKGRPPKGFTVAEMISAKVTDDDWELILAKAVEQAKGGDKSARDYLTNRKDGMPRQTQINIDQNQEPIILIDDDT